MQFDCCCCFIFSQWIPDFHLIARQNRFGSVGSHVFQFQSKNVQIEIDFRWRKNPNVECFVALPFEWYQMFSPFVILSIHRRLANFCTFIFNLLFTWHRKACDKNATMRVIEDVAVIFFEKIDFGLSARSSMPLQLNGKLHVWLSFSLWISGSVSSYHSWFSKQKLPPFIWSTDKSVIFPQSN